MTSTAPRNQSEVPIIDTLVRYAAEEIYPLHTPGHKAGRFAPPELEQLLGSGVARLDLPSMTATDSLLHPSGCIREAERLAAELFGAGETFYLTGGSTQGVAAMVLAATPPGATIVLARNVHRSVASALVLSGAMPRFLPPTVLADCGPLGATPDQVAAALAADPKPSAVLLTRPSYHGLARDLEEVAQVCHRAGVPLLVDEAHGAHLRFVPPGGPRPALDCGADLVVQSCHKTLGSLVGSAQLHVRAGGVVAPERVRDALNLLHSTSASFLLLASLDAARRRLALEGESLFANAVRDVEALQQRIDALPGLRCLDPSTDSRLAGHRRDPLRLTINVAQTGWTGYDVERHLRLYYRVEDEMADWYNIVLVLSPGDATDARERLVAGLAEVSRSPRPIAADAIDDPTLLQAPIPPLVMPPRDASLGPKKTEQLADSVGAVCAETVTFYPPGVPILMPGELVTDEILDACRRLVAGGAHSYANDPTLEQLTVVA